VPHLIEIAFKGNRKEFFLWTEEAPPALRSAVVVEADRGEDLGYVHALGELAVKRAAGCSHGPGSEAVSRVARRLASDDEIRRLREVREQDESARRKAIERVKANGLAMKLSDAEWRWDRRKLTLYFTAEKRVDFRNLVRELAAMFRTRIELKQIGVRDEAKRLSGIGRCGREYCSASWLPELRPVNLGVAKDQRLSLNPSQISGACGRLMCCLRYEHDFYVRQRKRFPKEGRLVVTPRGEEKVVSNDIFRERITLRSSDGELRVVSLVEFRRDAGVGATVEMPADEETPVQPMEALTDELILLQDTSERPAWRPRARDERGGKREEGRGKRDEEKEKREGRSLPVVPQLEEGEPVLEPDESESDPEARGARPTDAASRPESGERRGRRRRRGRRGGRRGRGGDRPPPAAPGGGTTGSPA
jgi:cell fate regulator YaaT (PSP1 superfamily)